MKPSRLPGRRLAVVVLALVLTACATPPAPAPGSTNWSGRLALRVDSQPPQSFSSAFDLRGGPEEGELRLNSPLGNTLASLVWGPSGAELRRGAERIQSGSLDALTAELTGAPLPVASLFAWLHGQDARVAGWQADLSQHAAGRITARRDMPEPRAELRLVFEP